MAKEDEENQALRRNIDKKLDQIDKQMDVLYQNTYQSRIDNQSNMDKISDDLDKNIDDLLSSVNGKDITDISSLYLRIQNKSRDSTSIEDQLDSLFNENGQLLDTLNVDNIRKSIQAEDYQYDLICRYMTKLEDAIEIKVDNVLSSDNFTKDFLTILSNKSSKESLAIFQDKAEFLKDEYRVQDLFEEMCYKGSKYGEYFLYHVPYKKAFERLLKRKQAIGSTMGMIGNVRYESGQMVHEAVESKGATGEMEVIFEAGHFDGNIGDNRALDEEFTKVLNENQAQVVLYFDEYGIIPDPISKAHETIRLNHKYSKNSVTESFLNEQRVHDGSVVSEVGEEGTKKNLKMDPAYAGIGSTEGLFDSTTGKRSPKLKDIPGSVIYEIPRDQIFPVVMHRTVIGYIHLQISNTYVENLVLNGYSYNSITNNTKLMADEFDRENDAFVSYIASMIADKIDAKFINANTDLKQQIFAVLRYNDKFCSTNGVNNIAISFIPASDIHHFYYKLDENTHRGISDLNKAVVPAMIYCLLYLNTTLGQISRSQDKRVYYVKQNVEQNVAKTLLNVINQLKKGNMGMRQLENMNTIFNVLGRYNDHIIPESQSGDPPIRMEVMQGQQIDTPTDLMDRMEDQAVNTTDVPLEFVQSTNQVDYATRFTMSNSKFLRKIYKRQRICQEHFTAIFRNLYNFEYQENDTTLRIQLPAPAYLAMTNSKTLVDNIKDYAKSVAEIVVPKQDQNGISTDDITNEFVNVCARNFLGSYIDFSQMDDMVKQAIHNIKQESDEDLDAGAQDAEEDMGGSEGNGGYGGEY